MQESSLKVLGDQRKEIVSDQESWKKSKKAHLNLSSLIGRKGFNESSIYHKFESRGDKARELNLYIPITLEFHLELADNLLPKSDEEKDEQSKELGRQLMEAIWKENET